MILCWSSRESSCDPSAGSGDEIARESKLGYFLVMSSIRKILIWEKREKQTERNKFSNELVETQDKPGKRKKNDEMM